MSTNWIERDQQAILSTYGRLPIVVNRGEGNYLFDEEDRKYLDLFTGLAVNILGHSHPTVLAALQEQAQRYLHISNYFYNKPAIALAEKLIKLSINGKVFFTNSGAEATEATLKIIHKWTKKNDHNKSGVIVLKNSFHGRTLGALKLTRQAGVYQDFPVTSMPVYEVEANNYDALKTVFEEKQPAAVIVEPVLGSGGIVTLTKEYLQQIESLCKEYEALCCMDEIQTGVGRTGRFFAYEHAEITPDMILFAKGIGGGLPLGGVIVAEKHTSLLQPGDHGTTFAPSPLSAALGNAVIDVLIEQGQMEIGTSVANELEHNLCQLKKKYHDLISGIRGMGMMIGVVMNMQPVEVKQIQTNLLQQGIMVDVTQQTIIRLLPPMTLTMVEVQQFIKKFELELLRIRGT
ncbi:aspartate aminotransferase family protein [Bacillus sp. JCM 19034]|uniref:aspartate aminotransferase family protein n=1 Tax=Bacillus sp. JCM 19034 TaxID=1481928 RepID=UPI000A86E996|nr:acetylornithine transaminase [Bacillus sp. JCM 19034]